MQYQFGCMQFKRIHSGFIHFIILSYYCINKLISVQNISIRKYKSCKLLERRMTAYG